MYVFWPSGFAHLGTAGAGFSAVLPYITMFLADNAASVYVDRKIAEGMSIEKARKLATVPHRPWWSTEFVAGFLPARTSRWADSLDAAAEPNARVRCAGVNVGCPTHDY